MKRIFFVLVFIFVNLVLFSQQGTTMSPDTTCALVVPSVLSSNGNDKLEISCPCTIISFKYTLYSRWGNKMYTVNKYSPVLDLDIHETHKTGPDEGNRKYVDGTYYWIAEYNVRAGGELLSKTARGTVTIIGGK